MRRLTLIGFALTLLAAAEAPAPDARTVARQVLEAHGGHKGLDRALNHGMQSGRIILYQPARTEGTFVAWADGERRRAEYKIGDQRTVEVYDGEHGWKVEGMRATPYSAIELVNAREQNHTGVAALLEMALDPTIRVSLTDGEYENEKLTGVRLTAVNGVSTLLLVDPKTHRVRVQETTVAREGGGRNRLRAVLDDYRTLPGGMIFPYHVVVYVGLPKSYEIFVDQVNLDAETPLTLFVPPLAAPK